MGSQTPQSKAEYRQLRDTVYTFFYYSNKPVVMTEITLQFKGVKKPQLQAVLDDLVEKDKIFVRDIGKSKVYCLSQNMSYEIDEAIYTDVIDKTVDQTIDDKTLRYLKWCYDKQMEELGALKEESKRLDGILYGYENQMSVEELRRVVKDMRALISAHDSKGKVEKVSYEVFSKQKKQYSEFKKVLDNRNKIFKEIVDVICDGSGMKKTELYKEADIEGL